MSQYFWDIDPEQVIAKNIYISNATEYVKNNIEILVEEYKKVANEIKTLIEKINGQNFEQTMNNIFDKEAYLSEIYFYLSRDILVDTEISNILTFIKHEYLLSYHGKLEEMEFSPNSQEEIMFLLKKWFIDRYGKLYKEYFFSNNSYIA